LAELLVNKFRLNLAGGGGVAWVLWLDPSSALGYVFAMDKLFSNDSTRLSGFGVINRFYQHFMEVVNVGIDHDLFTDTTPKPGRFRVGDYIPPGTHLPTDLSVYESCLLKFSTEIHYMVRKDPHFSVTPSYYDQIVSKIHFSLPGMNSNQRAIEHFVALLAILGVIPLGFYHMCKFDCTKSKTYHDFATRYSDSLTDGTEWLGHVSSAMKKWLLDNGKNTALVKCPQYVQSAIDVVGTRLQPMGSEESQGLLKLDGNNYVVSNGVLQCFNRDQKQNIIIGPRGIYAITSPDGTGQLQSCWDEPTSRLTLDRLKLRSQLSRTSF